MATRLLSNDWDNLEAFLREAEDEDVQAVYEELLEAERRLTERGFDADTSGQFALRYFRILVSVIAQQRRIALGG